MARDIRKITSHTHDLYQDDYRNEVEFLNSRIFDMEKYLLKSFGILELINQKDIRIEKEQIIDSYFTERQKFELQLQEIEQNLFEWEFDRLRHKYCADAIKKVFPLSNETERDYLLSLYFKDKQELVWEAKDWLKKRGEEYKKRFLPMSITPKEWENRYFKCSQDTYSFKQQLKQRELNYYLDNEKHR